MGIEQPFTPVNDLERHLQGAQKKNLTGPFMEQLFAAELFMPTTVPLDQGLGQVVPLAWDREGTPMAAVFTSVERMAPHQEVIRGYVTLSGAEIFSKSKPGWGVVINPGWTVGMEIFGHGLEEIRNGLKARNANAGTDSGRWRMLEANSAICAARAGRMSQSAMLGTVLASHVSVPLAKPLVTDGDRLVSWAPASVTTENDGEQFVPVFTDETLDRAYWKSYPEHGYRFQVQAGWLLDVLPPGHGLAFNIGGQENTLLWPARGILAYKQDAARRTEAPPPGEGDGA